LRKIELVKKYEAQLIAVCAVLLGAAVWWLVSTRPVHRIEGDFLLHEQRREFAGGWLASQLESGIAQNRARACLALGRIGERETLDLLLPLLKDPSPRVRMMAAFAIGQLEAHWREDPPREEAAAALMEVLEDEERAVVANAVEALGKMRWAPALDALKGTPAPLPFTLAAMSRIGDLSAVPWMREKLKSDDQDIRWAAARALNELSSEPDSAAVKLYLNLAEDRDERVRAETARALGRAQPSPQVLETLAGLSEDPDPKVRIAALGSLAALGSREGFEPVALRLEDPNPNVRSAAVKALGALGDSRAIPLLGTLANEGGPASAAARRALQQVAPARYEVLDVEPPPPGMDLDQGDQPHRVRIRPAKLYPEAELQRIARSLNRFVRVLTSIGPLDVLLDYEQASLTSEAFLSLARQGAFDGGPFSAEPGRWLAAGVLGEARKNPVRLTNEVNPRRFLRGSLGIRTGSRGEVQGFFICLSPQPLLDGRYTNFGRLISGDELLDRISPETQLLAVTLLER